MADYSEYKPRQPEDDLEDLKILENVILGYRALAFNGDIKEADRSTRSDYALQRLRTSFESMIKYRDNRWK